MSDKPEEFDVDFLLGDHDEEDCGPAENSDVVDDALQEVIDLLVKSGYDDVDSEDAVFSALEQLHSSDQCTDTPDIDATEQIKMAWIFNTVPRLKSKLKDMGLDF